MFHLFEEQLVMDWMFVFSQNSYVEILTPNVMVLGGRAFGRWWGHEGKAIMNGISTLIKETPENSLASSAMSDHSKKMAI